MKKTSGFTLIELLVVISIIALLLSILMPGLQKAKESARSVLCLSNLKQFGTVYEMYTMDNNDSLPGGWNSGRMWMVDLFDYYGGADDIRLCPETRKFLHETDGIKGVFVAWGEHGHPDLWDGQVPLWSEEGMYGSYGANGWAHNAPDQGVSGTYNIPPDQRNKFWRKKSKVTNPMNVPLMADAMWDGTTPEPDDLPPPRYEDLDDPTTNTSGYNMWTYMMPRHKNKTQMLLMDLSVEKVGLKELWSHDWHKQWEEKEINWPDWMEGNRITR